MSTRSQNSVDGGNSGEMLHTDHAYSTNLGSFLDELPEEARYLFNPIPSTLPLVHTHIHLLEPGKWLDDTIIDDFLALLASIFSATDSVLVVSSVLCQSLSSIKRVTVTNQCLKFLTSEEALNKELVLIPINISNTHWILGVIVWSSNSIYLFDSLFDKEKSFECHFEALFQLVTFSYAIAGLLLSPREWTFYLAKDSYDCGVIVCFNAAMIIAWKKIAYDPLTAKKWIKWIMSRPLTDAKAKITKVTVQKDVVARLRGSTKFSIKWTRTYVHELIQSATAHQGNSEMCSAPICQRPLPKKASMDMCIVCRSWYHRTCKKFQQESKYFVCQTALYLNCRIA